MTEDEHKERHVALHQALDELIADWLEHQPLTSGKRFSNTTIMELIEWSHAQTHAPTPLRSESAAETMTARVDPKTGTVE